MVNKELTKEQLAESYLIATIRLHSIITDFYEDLHDQEGGPCINPGVVANMLIVMKVMLDHELDLVKDACYEHFESNYDEGEQAKILFEDGLGS